MKIKISTVVDVPDDCLCNDDKYSSAVECIFDGITHYVVMKHIEDSTKWYAKAKDNELSTEFRLYKYHNDWYELCTKLNWNFEKVIYEN